MSYDIQLVIDTGGEYPASVTEMINPTYNLGKMFREALGCPIRDLEGKLAYVTIDWLAKAIEDMKARPDHYKTFNPDNGWGDHAGALETLEWMLAQAKAHPKATWRI